MNIVKTNSYLKNTLTKLASTPKMRPFLFRTRFERSMRQLLTYANETDQTQLADLALSSLRKMDAIVDKSNTTADGELRSYTLLVDDIKKALIYL